MRGLVEPDDGTRAPRAPWRSPRGAACVLVVALLAAAGTIALLPFHGTATHSTGSTTSIACGTPYHERSTTNPSLALYRYLLGEAATRNPKSATAAERATGGPTKTVIPDSAIAGTDHFNACHHAAQRRMGIAGTLALLGLVGALALYFTWPVLRDEERERPRRLGYQPALDGLRALSIIVVMLFHAGLHSRLIGQGYLGVGAFFVLSGFLITTLILDEHRRWERVNLRHFYARRALRLLPLIVVAVAVGFVIRLVMSPDVARPNGESLVGTLFYFSNWVAYFRPGSLGILDHTWSLAIEEQFYLLWPPVLVWLLARHTKKSRLVAMTAAACLASALLRTYLWRNALAWRPKGVSNPIQQAQLVFHHLDQQWNHWYVSSFTRADALLVGCLTAILISTIFTTNVRGRRALHVLTVVGIVSVAGVYWETGKPFDTFPSFLAEWGLLLFSVGVALLVVAVVFQPTSLLGRALSVRPLTWIGKRSYGMYVIHWPVIVLLNRHFHFGQWNVAITIGITFILSAISFRYLESPMLRLKGRFSRSGGPDTRAPTGVAGTEPEVVTS